MPRIRRIASGTEKIITRFTTKRFQFSAITAVADHVVVFSQKTMHCRLADAGSGAGYYSFSRCAF